MGLLIFRQRVTVKFKESAWYRLAFLAAMTAINLCGAYFLAITLPELVGPWPFAVVLMGWMLALTGAATWLITWRKPIEGWFC
jgi:hypothetical protein